MIRGGFVKLRTESDNLIGERLSARLVEAWFLGERFESARRISRDHAGKADYD